MSFPQLAMQLIAASTWSEKSQQLVRHPELKAAESEPYWAALLEAAPDDATRQVVAAHVQLVRQVREHGLIATLGDLIAEETAARPRPDPRMVGTWEHRTTQASPFGTAVSCRLLTLGEDGRFHERQQSASSSTQVDSEGQWMGSAGATSGQGAPETGQWSLVEGHLQLVYDRGVTVLHRDLEIHWDCWMVPAYRQLWRRI